MKQLTLIIRNRSITFQQTEPIEENLVRLLFGIAGACTTAGAGGAFAVTDRRTARQVAIARRLEWNQDHPRPLRQSPFNPNLVSRRTYKVNRKAPHAR